MTARKLVRSNCTTAQVVAALTKHPTWTAEAPRCPQWVEMVASFFNHQVAIKYPDPNVVTPACHTQIPDRSDWSIYRPEKKRKVIRSVKISESSEVSFSLSALRDLDPSKTYRLLLVEVD